MKSLDTVSTITKEEVIEAVHAVATALSAEYRNGFSLIGILESGRAFTEAVSSVLDLLHCRHMVGFLGAKTRVQEDGTKRCFIYSPPSVHLLHNRPVVVLDGFVKSGKTAKFIGNFINQSYQEPSSMAFGALVVQAEEAPVWLSKSLSGFLVPVETPPLIGFGLEYNNEDQRQGWEITTVNVGEEK